jgi:putative acetyltransferase
LFTIRQEQFEDRNAIYELNTLAFQQENESKLIDAIRASEFFIPELSLVAVKEKEVIGHILFSMISIETRNGAVPTLGLAPMAVKPEYQNQGIGSALVREGLKRCEQLGFEHVVVLGHPHFYPKFGFQPAILKGIKPPFQVPDEAFMVLEIKKGSLKDINGTVKYPPAFAIE